MRIIHFPGIYRIRVLCGWSRWDLYCKVAPVVAIDPDLTLDFKNNLIQEKLKQIRIWIRIRLMKTIKNKKYHWS